MLWRIDKMMKRAGIEMQWAQLRWRFPEETNAEIDERLNAWLREWPGAEFGDSPGRVVDPASVLN